MRILDHDHDHDNKYITTQVFNKLTAEHLTARVNQANLATKSDIDDFVENTDFDNKLENLNKKVTSNKSEHVEAEKKKLTGIRKKVAHVSEKGFFLLGRMYFTGDDGYHHFLVFKSVLSSLTLDNTKKAINCILKEIPAKRVKPFNNNLELIISNLANGRRILKLISSVLVQRNSFSLYSNFILNLYIFYEPDNWSRNRTNNFTIKNCLIVEVKLARNKVKSKFIYNGEVTACDEEGTWRLDMHGVHDFARNVVIFGIDKFLVFIFFYW